MAVVPITRMRSTFPWSSQVSISSRPEGRGQWISSAVSERLRGRKCDEIFGLENFKPSIVIDTPDYVTL